MLEGPLCAGPGVGSFMFLFVLKQPGEVRTVCPPRSESITFAQLPPRRWPSGRIGERTFFYHHFCPSWITSHDSTLWAGPQLPRAHRLPDTW